MQDYTSELFTGTAAYYKKYRRDYPNVIYNELEQRVNLDEHATVLDIGCGPGMITLRLAPKVSSVTAVDPDPEMLKELERSIDEQKVTNIVVYQNTFEAFNDDAKYDLVVFGTSLHWIKDQQRGFEKIHKHLKTGGYFSMINGSSVHIWTENPKNGWRYEVTQVIQKYLGEKRRAGASTFSNVVTRTQGSYERILMSMDDSFTECTTTEYTEVQKYSVDEILGLLYSTSFARRDYFGNKINHFEQDVRDVLNAHVDSGGYIQEPSRTWMILARAL